MRHDGWPLPESDNYVLQVTDSAGRAVFARRDVKPDTQILSTTDEAKQSQSPTAHVILRPYRREVCAQCFAYDRGREWKCRLGDAGVVFCKLECQQRWESGNGQLGLAAHQAVESAIKKQLKRRGNAQDGPVLDDHLPSEPFVSAWRTAGLVGNQISVIRTEEKPSKADLRLLRTAEGTSTDPDILAYILSAVLEAHKRSATAASIVDDEHGQSDHPGMPGTHLVTTLFPDMMALADDPAVYSGNYSSSAWINAYHHLLAILPTPLLQFLQPALCHEMASRASHNAFSIRPAGTSDGEQSGEFLGWGVWPEASFFNHSCRPNVRKERVGRVWVFTVSRGIDGDVVRQGEQLCITYLGGDERDLGVLERRKKLKDEWGFDCQCPKCAEELAVLK